MCSFCCSLASFWCNSSIYLHHGQSLISCQGLGTHRHPPFSDENLLVAIIEDAIQLALAAAIAWLRSRTLNLLPAASSAADPRTLARHHTFQDTSAYAFRDLLATRDPFPAMRTDYIYRMWCRRLAEGRGISILMKMRGNQPAEPIRYAFCQGPKITGWPIVHVPTIGDINATC